MKTRNPFARLLSVPLLLVAAACSASPTATPLPSGPEVAMALVTTDFAQGENRVVFGLVALDGTPLQAPEVQVRAVYTGPGQTSGQVGDNATARFIRWPAGARGVYVTRLNLDAVGDWRLEVDVTMADGRPVTAQGAFQVAEESLTPAIGAQAPASATYTADGVDGDLPSITSDPHPDPDLYGLSIRDALQAGKPLMVVFATPGFCVTATCGPQVQVVSGLKERFADEANFIHVEIFEDPDEMARGRASGGFVPAVSEWSLPTEPWTFIMDRGGRVRAKFEGFTTTEELEEALREVIESRS